MNAGQAQLIAAYMCEGYFFEAAALFKLSMVLRWDQSGSDPRSIRFPILASQIKGLEDLRWLRFMEDEGTARYLGTYTALNGSEVRQEARTTQNFRRFRCGPSMAWSRAARPHTLSAPHRRPLFRSCPSRE